MKNSQNKTDVSRRSVIVFSTAVLLCMVLQTLQADSIRCGRKVIRTGDSSSLLLKKCGQPDSKDRGVEQVKLDEGRKKVRVERWHYQKSSRSLSRAVWIYRGKVVAVDTGGR